MKLSRTEFGGVWLAGVRLGCHCVPALLAAACLWSCSALAQSGEPTPLKPAATPSAVRAGPVGPTLRLDYGRGEAQSNRIANFMYFVPLISPGPVSIAESTNNSQVARVISAKRQGTPDHFALTCEFEITGTGWQRNQFDYAAKIRSNERKLKEGGSLNHLLDYIHVEGAGFGTIEVEGTSSNGVPTVTEVRLRFNERAKPSPVSIGLKDVKSVDGVFRDTNEKVARVNTLTFQRGAVPPRMSVTVASVRSKAAGNNLWQKFMGGIAGTAANLLLKPIRVDPAGHEAMLDFGRALLAQEPTFTFPPARNLK